MPKAEVGSMKLRASLLLLLSVPLLYVRPTHAQAAPAPANAVPEQPSARFTSRAELVIVPAIVTDRSGKHVSGLAKEDFTVLENGAAQKIATFDEMKASALPVRRTAPQDGIFTNIMTGSPEPRRLNIIVLDLVNTAFSDQAYARSQILKFLNTAVESNELTALLTFNRSGVRVVHDFTTDPQILAAALKKLRGEIHMMAGENEGAEAEANAGVIDVNAVANEASSIDAMMSGMEAQSAQMMRQFATLSTLDAFNSISAAYAGVPGRKALIWVTGSFPFIIDDFNNARTLSFASRWQRIVDNMNSANISIYPVDARGLVYVGFTASENVRINPRNPGAQLSARLSQHQATIETMQNFASMTGGRAFYNNNDIAGAAARAAEDSSQYYVLGYYRQPQEKEKPGWRKLQVKVNQERAHVRARSGFFVTEQNPSPEQLRNADLRTAVSSPFDFTALPLWLRLNAAPKAATEVKQSQSAKPEGTKAVALDIRLGAGSLTVATDDNNLSDLDLIAVARDGAMTVADQITQHLQAHLKPASVQRIAKEGLTFHGTLNLKPGEYNVRLVVRDNLSGRVGSLQAPIKVE
jgi:VWFA-related protein